MRDQFTRIALLLFVVHCGGGSPPRELSPRVVTSSIFKLTTSRTLANVNIITDIEVTPNGQVIAIGNQGAVVLSRALQPMKSGTFEGFGLFRADSIIQPVISDSVVVVSTFNGEPQLAAFKLDGKSIWTYEEKNPLVSGTHGLLPEIGTTGAVVVSHANRGLVILDVNDGSVIEEFRAPFAPEVRTADTDGDGKTEIAQMNESGLELWSNDGRLLARRNIVASWAVACGFGRPDSFASWDGLSFQLLGRNLETLATIRASFPGSEIPALHLDAAAVFHEDRNDFAAFLLGGRGGWHRTTLVIYDLSGRLLHQEILPDDFMSLRFASPNRLFVGGRNVLRVYTFAKAPPNSTVQPTPPASWPGASAPRVVATLRVALLRSWNRPRS